MTIRSIAELARVSPATVSHALLGREGVSVSTRERIKALATELGFKPDWRRQNARRKRFKFRRRESLVQLHFGWVSDTDQKAA